MATSSIDAVAGDAVPNPPNTVAVTSVAVAIASTERNHVLLVAGSGVLNARKYTVFFGLAPVRGNGLPTGNHTGSTFEISQEPCTFVSVISTLLGVTTGSGLSLLLVL